MKYGIAIPNYGKYADKDSMLRISLVAEELGFDSLWVSDHLVVPKGHKDFGNVFFDLVVTLTYLASSTKKIKLGTSVIVLLYRNPVVFAKEISTLDLLSGGRVIMCIGTGWLREEFHALGINYEERGDRTDEYLEIIKELYINEAPTFNGKYHNISDIDFYPKPLQKPSPPVWVGGSSQAALKQAAKYGNGWHAVGSTPDEIKEKSKELNRLLAEYNRIESEFVVSVRKSLQVSSSDISDERELLRRTMEKITDGIDAYKNAGVSYMVLQILISDIDGVIEAMKIVSEKLIN